MTLRRKWICLLLLVGLGSCNARVSPEELYRLAYANFLAGDFRAADRQTAQGVKSSRGQTGSEWRSKFLLLRARVMLLRGQVDAARALLESFPRHELPLEITRKSMVAAVLINQSRYAEAGSLLEQAEKQSARAGAASYLPEIQILKATLNHRQSRDDLAEPGFRLAVDSSREQHDRLSQARALINLGLIRMQKLQPDAAIPYFQQAYSAAGAIGARYYAELARDNIASCYGLLGDFDKAFAMHQQAIAFFEKADAGIALEQSIGEFGSLYLDRGEPQAAALSFKRALDLAESVQKDSDASIWAINLAAAYIDLRRWDEAAVYNRKAAARLREADSLQDTQLNAAAIAAGKGHTVDAENLYRELVSASGRNPDVLWKAQAGYGALTASQGRSLEARAHFEGAIQVIEQTRADLLLGDHRITFLARLIQFYRQYVRFLVQQGEIARALYVADSSRALALTDGLAPPAGDTPDYRRIAKEWGGVLLSYWIAPDQSYLWAVSANEIRLVKLPPEKDLTALVEAYRASIEQQISDPLQSGSVAGHKLYDTLVQPVAGMLPAGVRVFLVADGPLHNLNFETLLTPGAGAHYWIQDATVSIAPSLRILASGPPPNTSADRTLLIGDPEGHEPDAPKLQFAQQELGAIGAAYPAGKCALYTGRDATPEVYRRTAANGFSTIHFSAHAIANRQSPLDSAIILSRAGGEYKLYARDIMNLPLHADLVTLSACRSAGARAYAGEGLVGFSWAFLHAGAHNVIAGLWDVGDRSTAAFMGRFYALLREGLAPADALRTAKIEFAASDYRKPYYWAPFQIYTTGRALGQ